MLGDREMLFPRCSRCSYGPGRPTQAINPSRWRPPLSEAREASPGEPQSRVGRCRAGQIAPQRLLTLQPEQMSLYKHGLHFHTNVCGRGKYTTGRQKCDIKAKSIPWKMLPGVLGASESRVSHLSEMVWKPDGALWRSIKQV